MSDFYEDDEPIEDILEAWHRGEKGLTTGPRELDDEEREALELTAEELLAKWENGRPANVRRFPPGQHAIKVPLDVSGIRIDGCYITGFDE